jgi:hypothetical protein
MKINNNKFIFPLKYLFAGMVLLTMVFTFILFPSKTGRLNYLAGENAVSSDVLSYDYVLVIDESGSMKRNDSANMRIDAAKLFVYLAETMNPGSRVLISGFGETLNIYQQMADISGNEKGISAAISKIRSDQDITDMKGALSKIKLMLDTREVKNKTIVIFLTDGSLTVDDIPAPAKDEQKPPRETTTETTTQDNPGRPVKDNQIKQDSNLISENTTGTAKNSISDNLAPAGIRKDPEYLTALKNLDTASATKDSLENYKQELIDLCYKYSNAGIAIYPIAFTQEADISLLEQIASITGGISWQAKEAKDLRVSFIEILKNITSRFIKIEEQKDSNDLSSSIPVGSYIKDLIVIGLQNNFNSIPQVMLTTPAGEAASYNDYTEESLFKIGKVISPQEGNWAYKIKGDAIFVYDIVDVFVSDPQYSVYTSDAKLLLKLDILKNSSEKLKGFTGDFKISSNILDPSGTVSATADLSDDGSNADSKAGDGIFTGNFEGQDLKGKYTFNFLISHIPTGSVAGKSVTLEFVEFPGKITVLEPSGDNYNLDKPVTVEVKLDKNEKINQSFNPENYKLTFSLIRPNGDKASDLVILDNGQGADKAAGDGVYSAVLQNTTLEGFYEIEFFIRDASVMTVPACTAIKKGFSLSKAPVLKISVENNLFAAGSTILSANFEDNSLNEFKYFLTAPDGTESSGILADDGSAANGDLKAADGIASVILPGTGIMGQYKFKVVSEYKTKTGQTVPVVSETTFSKELSISKPDRIVQFEENAVSSQATLKVASQASSAKQIAIDLQKFDTKALDNKIIKSVKINGNKTLDSGSESSVVLTIELEDKVKSGNYKIVIPFIVDGISTDSVTFDVSIMPASAPYFIWVVIGAVVLAIAIIVLFVYFLYIRPKKRGY